MIFVFHQRLICVPVPLFTNGFIHLNSSRVLIALLDEPNVHMVYVQKFSDL